MLGSKGLKLIYHLMSMCSFAKVFLLKADSICILSPGLNLCFAMLNNFNAKSKKLSEKGNVLV